MSIKLNSASVKGAQALREFLDYNRAVITQYNDRIEALVYQAYAPGFSEEDCMVAPDVVEHPGYLEPHGYCYPWNLTRLTYLTEDWALLATLGDRPSKANIPLIIVN